MPTLISLLHNLNDTAGPLGPRNIPCQTLTAKCYGVDCSNCPLDVVPSGLDFDNHILEIFPCET